MAFLYIVSVWLHIVAGAVYIGGMVFLVAVMVPMIRRPEFRNIAVSVIHWTGMRFRWVGWLCLVLLLVTGIFNLVSRGWIWSELFILVLGVKLLLFMVIICASALHDFIVGPQATTLWQASPGSAEGLRLRRLASRIGRLNLLLGLIIIALGVILVRGLPW